MKYIRTLHPRILVDLTPVLDATQMDIENEALYLKIIPIRYKQKIKEESDDEPADA